MLQMHIQGIHPRNIKDVQVEMLRIGVPAGELEPLSDKSMFQVLRITGISQEAAQITRDKMAASGGNTAMPLSAHEKQGAGSTDVLLMGTREAYMHFISKLSTLTSEPAEIARLVKDVLLHIDGSVSPEHLMWPDGPMVFGHQTYVMGIINCTPDSFYDGGENLSLENAITTARRMIEDGVDIIDVGGESARPGSSAVSTEEEIGRTVPFIRTLKNEFPEARISIDTVKAQVAKEALEAGAAMINDISGLRSDPEMKAVAADSGAPVCIMHMQGTPSDMQKNPSYPGDVCYEINTFFRERIHTAIEAGVRKSQIVLDPGIGFGKTVEHNLEILSRLNEFRSHGLPILVGASRKSFIGKTLELEPEERLEGSLAAAVLSVSGGADIIRVHDVKETLRAVRLADAVARKGRMIEKKGD